jgi:hypothetical protein
VRIAIAATALVSALIFGITAVIASAVGWMTLNSTSGASPGHPFYVTVTNDRGTSIALQPCAQYTCGSEYEVATLVPDQAVTFATSTSPRDIHSFVVKDPTTGRILGCLGETVDESFARDLGFKTSQVDDCVT